MQRQKLISTMEGVASLLKPAVRTLLGFGGLYDRFRDWYLRAVLKILRNRYSLSIGTAQARFSVGSVAELERLRRLQGEEAIVRDLLSMLSREDVFFDVGANIGVYTCLAANLLPAGHVIAFEPHPDNYRILTKNVGINGLQVQLLQTALSDETGLGRMAEWSPKPGEGGHRLTTGDSESGIPVELMDGDSLVRDRGVTVPTVIKIDVEGAEMKVLRGLKGTLQSGRVRTVYCEVHPAKLQDYGDSASAVWEFLSDAGFRLQHIGAERKNEVFVRAVRDGGRAGAFEDLCS